MKRFFATLTALLIVLCLYLFVHRPAANPSSDLASPSQETRDAAAKILRATAKPPWKIKWFFFTRHIKIGENKTNILELLRSYNLKPEPGLMVGSLSEFAEYYLDDYWTLGCEYNSDDKSLTRWKLLPGWRPVGVWPSTNSSGVWINYYANGQKFTEGDYTNGIRFGEFITFDPNGSTNSIWHYDHNKANGLWAQYFPSGQVQFQCQYSNNMRVGIWVRYNEDGSTNSIKDLSKP